MLWCGTGKRVISPGGPVSLAGYAARWGKKTDGSIHDDLYAKALFLKSEGTSVLLMAVDLCEVSDAPRIQEALRAKLHIDHVLVTATHTHSGPYTEESRSDPGAFDPAWYAWAVGLMEEAAREAMQNTFRAGLAASQADVPGVGKNRRPGHTITDPALTVLQVVDAENAVRAVWLNYACHATVLDGNSFALSADYPGFLYQHLEAAYPAAEILFTNGAAGDINIGYSSDASALGEPMAFRSFERAEAVARELAEEAMRLLSAAEADMAAPFAAHAFSVTLPLRQNRPGQQELHQFIAQADERIQKAADDISRREAQIRKIYWQSLRDSLANLGAEADAAIPTLLVRAGDLVLISSPAELFCQVGLAIKGHVPAPLKSAIIGYAGGYVGYLPTREAMLEGGYEAEVSPFAPETADAYVRAIGAELNRWLRA